MRALLLSGEGRYSDPWHPFRETSAAVADLLTDRGHRVEVRGDVEEALAEELQGLVVVNVGLPRDGSPSPSSTTARDGLARLRDSTLPVLALHVSSTSFADAPEWTELLGGRWVPDVTLHPDFGPARIRVRRDRPAVQDVPDFDVEDERYSWLEVADSAEVLAVHEHDGVEHPLVWALERPSGGRTVYDALGHTAEPYRSPGHRALLAAALDHLGV